MGLLSTSNSKPGHSLRNTGFLNSKKGGGTPLHRYRQGKKPKKEAKTAQEDALERRQSAALDKEIEDSEEKFKALARGKLGRVSLLTGAPKNAKEATSGPSNRGGSGGVGGIGIGSTPRAASGVSGIKAPKGMRR